jgi:hypothetical protein
LRCLLVDIWASSSNFVLKQTVISPVVLESYHPGNTYHGELIKWSRLLNILQRLLQILQLQINTSLGLLGIFQSLRLKSLNRLDLSPNIVCRGLEGIEMLLNLLDNGLVLQNRTVVYEVDFGGLFGELGHSATGIFVALLKSLERGNGLAAETEGGGDFGPVELERCTSLKRRYVSYDRKRVR